MHNLLAIGVCREHHPKQTCYQALFPVIYRHVMLNIDYYQARRCSDIKLESAGV